MRVQNLKTWVRVRSSFWFIPAVMASGAMVLAFATVALDEPVTNWLTLNWGWTFTGGAEGASSLLGVIAGSITCPFLSRPTRSWRGSERS